MKRYLRPAIAAGLLMCLVVWTAMAVTNTDAYADDVQRPVATTTETLPAHTISQTLSESPQSTEETEAAETTTATTNRAIREYVKKPEALPEISPPAPKKSEDAVRRARSTPPPKETQETLPVVGVPTTAPNETEAQAAEPEWVLYATCTITHYCPGACCCGKWASGYTASGSWATEGRTVAMESLPFGTEVMINGHVYIVEDRGVYGDWVDIFRNSHEQALIDGMYTAPVYIRNPNK